MKKILLLVILSTLVVSFSYCQDPDSPLQLVIKSDKEIYEVGEKVKIEVVMKNISNKQVIVWHAGFWTNHKVILVAAYKESVPLTDFGKECNDAFSRPVRKKNIRWPLAPGQEDRYEFELNQLYLLSAPGIYYLTVIYQENYPGGWTGALTSNALAIEVNDI